MKSGRRLSRSAWFVVPVVGMAVVAVLVVVGLVWDRGSVETVAAVGVPPVVAAVLAWLLAETTRDREQVRQEQLRTDERERHEAGLRRDYRRDNLLRLQAALKVAYVVGIEWSSASELYRRAVEAFPDDPSRWPGRPQESAPRVMIDASAELDACAAGTDDFELIGLANQFNNLILLASNGNVTSEGKPLGTVLRPAFLALTTIVTRRLRDLYEPVPLGPTRERVATGSSESGRDAPGQAAPATPSDQSDPAS